MKELIRYEELFLEAILKKEKRRIEEFLKDKNKENSLEAYFARNESLPIIESLLKKIEL